MKTTIMRYPIILGLLVVCGCSPTDNKWTEVSETKDPDVLLAYIKQYPNTQHRREAEAQIEKLHFETELASLLQLPRFRGTADAAARFKDAFVSSHAFPPGCDDPDCRELLLWSLAQAKRKYAPRREVIADIRAVISESVTNYGAFHMEMNTEDGKKMSEMGLFTASGTLLTKTKSGEECSLKIVPIPTAFGQSVATGSIVVTGMCHDEPAAKGVCGSLTLEQKNNDLVAKTSLPSDRIVFDVINKQVFLPNGPGSILGLSGQVTNYFRGYTFQSLAGSAYFVFLKDDGLCYLAGQVTVKNEAKSFHASYP